MSGETVAFCSNELASEKPSARRVSAMISRKTQENQEALLKLNYWKGSMGRNLTLRARSKRGQGIGICKRLDYGFRVNSDNLESAASMYSY